MTNGVLEQVCHDLIDLDRIEQDGRHIGRRIEHPERKPGPGMLLRAARELELDLGASWMIGDSLTDAWAGRHAGCARSVLIHTALTTPEEERDPAVDFVVHNLEEAVELTRQQISRAILEQ